LRNCRFWRTTGYATGLPLGQAFEIADQLPYADLNPSTVEDALKTAYSSRGDFRLALGSAKSAEQALSAAKGQRYPVVAVNGDYGDQGSTFGQSHGIFSFQAGVNLPIFTGGRVKGDITQAEAALRQRKAEAENIRGQIDYDVRTAFLSLNAAKEQVDVAHQNVDLANDNVARSKERFAADVTDSVEVVRSEQSLASANDQYITSLVRYEQLVAKQDISRQQYDQAVAAAKGNRSGVVSANASVQAAQQAVRQAQGKLMQARADLRSAQTAPQQVSMTRAKADAADAQARERKAQIDQAELNFSYTVVRSPVTGIIGKKTVEVGQNVGIGQELVEVVPLDDVWVTANFKETQLAHMRPGQPVEIKVDAYGRTWKAHVTNLGAGAGSVFSLLPPENATGNYVKVVQRAPPSPAGKARVFGITPSPSSQKIKIEPLPELNSP
jgi:membrane fusion protein (multidrug efflux system)